MAFFFSRFLINVPAAVITLMNLNATMNVIFTLPVSVVSIVRGK